MSKDKFEQLIEYVGLCDWCKRIELGGCNKASLVFISDVFQCIVNFSYACHGLGESPANIQKKKGGYAPPFP